MSDSWDISRASSTANSLVQLLTPEHVPVIDEIVERVPPDGTFPDAIKAYNEVMRARGLDPDDDVVYYRFMLKLSMEKGAWRDKWAQVKADLEHRDTFSTAASSTFATSPRFASRALETPAPRLSRLSALRGRQDSQTLSTTRLLASGPSSTARKSLDPKTRLQELLRHHSAAASTPPPRPRPTAPAQPSVKGKEREVEPPAAYDPKPLSAHALAKLETAADVFREALLVDKAWAAWRAGFHWIQTTGQQAQAAADQLTVHKALLRWNRGLHQHEARMEEAKRFDNERVAKHHLKVWLKKCQRKVHQKMRMQEWRMDMRRRMAAVQSARNRLLAASSLKIWRSKALEVVWRRKQQARLLGVWRTKLDGITHQESLALQFRQSRNQWLAASAFDRWKELWQRQSALRTAEEQFRGWMARRVARRTLIVWRQRSHSNYLADEHRRGSLAKFAIRRWKTRVAKVQDAEQSATRRAHRRDKLLARVYLGVWAAQLHGRRVEQSHVERNVRYHLLTWVAKTRAQRVLETRADVFAHSQDAPLAVGAFKRWKAKIDGRNSWSQYAGEHYEARLKTRTFSRWVEALSRQLILERQAEDARDRLLMERYFKQWREAVLRRRLRASYRTFKQRKQLQHLQHWRYITRLNREGRLIGSLIVARSTLSRWVKRTVEIKERELVVQERADQQLVAVAFDRWRSKLEKIRKDESLQESFTVLQQQNFTRSFLYSWRSALQKRRILAQNEETVAYNQAVSTAYTVLETWRAKVVERRLSELERHFQLQMDTNLRVYFFSRWYAQTTSLPAINFRVTHLKDKFWRRWRAAMTPALQARKARQMDEHRVMIFVFEKWQAAYKKKLALKVAAMKWRHVPSVRPSSQVPANTFVSRKTPSSAATRVSSTTTSRRPSLHAAQTRLPQESPGGSTTTGLRTPAFASREPAPQIIQDPPSPSPPPRRASAAPALADSWAEPPSRRPRKMVAASLSSTGGADDIRPTALFSRPMSATGYSSTPGGRGGTSTPSDVASNDGLWRHLRGGLLARGTRTRSPSRDRTPGL